MKIGIVGGGIAGLTAAIALQQKGYQVTVLEAAPALKAVGAGLGLGANAMKAYAVLGLDEELKNICKIMSGFTLVDESGKVLTGANTSASGASYTVHRADLHEFLFSKLNPETILLGKRLKTLSQDISGVKLSFEDGTQYEFDRVIGADGIHSAVRQAIFPQAVTRYSGYTCWRGVAHFSEDIIAGPSETLGKNGRFGLVPLTDHLIYWYACVNTTLKDPFLKQWNISNLIKKFGHYHAPIKQVLENTANEALIWSDISDLTPINQFAFDRVVLIGDAAHATTPNMGQGACQAIEDAVILAHLMQEYSETAFTVFEERRRARVHWVVKQSWQMGKVMQLENPFLISLRNTLFRMMPASANEKIIAKVADFRLN